MLKLIKATVIISLLFSLGVWAENKTIEASVNANEVETGEIFTYRIKIEGNFVDPVLTLPEFKNFRIASQNQSKSYLPTKEGTKLEINFIYQLFAVNRGAFTIKPVILKDKGKKYRSKSITIKVTGRPLEEKRKILPYIEKGINL